MHSRHYDAGDFRPSLKSCCVWDPDSNWDLEFVYASSKGTSSKVTRRGLLILSERSVH